MATPCNERVGKGIITFACDVEAGHSGPHRALENQPSVRERQRWQESAKAKDTLASFQGEAQTTAQRYTENPTSVPLSDGRRRLHMDCSATEGCLVRAHTECPHADFDWTYVEVPAPEQEPQMPEAATQSWDLPTGDGVIIRQPGGIFSLISEGRNEPVEITQQEAIKMLAPVKDIGPAHPQYAQVMAEEMESGRNGWNPGGLKQREGDQVLPTVNDRQDIQSMVMADLEARRQVGISRYGTALQAFNGRDMLRDLYEELMDACVYIRGVIEERDSS